MFSSKESTREPFCFIFVSIEKGGVELNSTCLSQSWPTTACIHITTQLKSVLVTYPVKDWAIDKREKSPTTIENLIARKKRFDHVAKQGDEETESGAER